MVYAQAQAPIVTDTLQVPPSTSPLTRGPLRIKATIQDTDKHKDINIQITDAADQQKSAPEETSGKRIPACVRQTHKNPLRSRNIHSETPPTELETTAEDITIPPEESYHIKTVPSKKSDKKISTDSGKIDKSEQSSAKAVEKKDKGIPDDDDSDDQAPSRRNIVVQADVHRPDEDSTQTIIPVEKPKKDGKAQTDGQVVNKNRELCGCEQTKFLTGCLGYEEVDTDQGKDGGKMQVKDKKKDKHKEKGPSPKVNFVDLDHISSFEHTKTRPKRAKTPEFFDPNDGAFHETSYLSFRDVMSKPKSPPTDKPQDNANKLYDKNVEISIETSPPKHSRQVTIHEEYPQPVSGRQFAQTLAEIKQFAKTLEGQLAMMNSLMVEEMHKAKKNQSNGLDEIDEFYPPSVSTPAKSMIQERANIPKEPSDKINKSMTEYSERTKINGKKIVNKNKFKFAKIPELSGKFVEHKVEPEIKEHTSIISGKKIKKSGMKMPIPKIILTDTQGAIDLGEDEIINCDNTKCWMCPTKPKSMIPKRAAVSGTANTGTQSSNRPVQAATSYDTIDDDIGTSNRSRKRKVSPGKLRTPRGTAINTTAVESPKSVGKKSKSAAIHQNTSIHYRPGSGEDRTGTTDSYSDEFYACTNDTCY